MWRQSGKQGVSGSVLSDLHVLFYVIIIITQWESFHSLCVQKRLRGIK